MRGLKFYHGIVLGLKCISTVYLEMKVQVPEIRLCLVQEYHIYYNDNGYDKELIISFCFLVSLEKVK